MSDQPDDQPAGPLHAELTGLLLSEQTVSELLAMIVDLAISTIPDVHGSSISLMTPNGHLETTSASSETIRRVDEAQYEDHKGPCVRAIDTGHEVTITLPTDQWPQFSDRALGAGMRSVHSFPLRTRDQTTGALNLYSKNPTPIQQPQADAARSLAQQAATVLANSAALTTAEMRGGPGSAWDLRRSGPPALGLAPDVRGQRSTSSGSLGQGHTVLAPVEGQLASAEQVHLLNRLSDPTLSELGLDEFLDELLVRVRDALAVDTVAILLLDEKSEHLVARAAKGLEEEVEREVRIPVGQGFAGRIASERTAIFIANVDRADIVNPILREVGIKSLLGVPLIVQGDLIGVLHVGSLTSRVFGPRDLAVLQTAAASAGPGIERARLFSALEHERGVALILQRSLLPKRLDPPSGLAAAARYLPATELVGGDWYDTFNLSGGRLGVAIGDVVGHGVRAAALMGQLRTALRAFAMQDHDPGDTLDLVDQFAHSISEDAMATAIYAIVDPLEHRVQVAGAGHLPPLILSEGSCRIVPLAPSVPLGAFPDAHRKPRDLALRAGQTLVLYTDGLVERRDVPLDESIDRLREIIAVASSPDEVCRLAVDQLVSFDDRFDDLAILAVKHV